MKKQEKTKAKYMKFCPNCKSTDVRTDFNPSIALGMPQAYVCNECGFRSIVFPEMKLEEKKQEQEEETEEKKEKDDKSKTEI